MYCAAWFAYATMPGPCGCYSAICIALQVAVASITSRKLRADQDGFNCSVQLAYVYSACVSQLGMCMQLGQAPVLPIPDLAATINLYAMLSHADQLVGHLCVCSMFGNISVLLVDLSWCAQHTLAETLASHAACSTIRESKACASS